MPQGTRCWLVLRKHQPSEIRATKKLLSLLLVKAFRSGGALSRFKGQFGILKANG